MELAKRVAYSPSYEYSILHGSALKSFSEQNHLDWSNHDLMAVLVSDLDGINKPGTIHHFRPEWMIDPALSARSKKSHATMTSRENNSREKAKQDSDRQKALESLSKVKVKEGTLA